MAIATSLLTLEEFIRYDDGTDTRYELENGTLLAMPSESDLNQRIASFLFALLLQLGIPSYRLRIGLELVVSGARTSVRLPDLVVLSEDLALALEGATRSLVTMDMPPPALVVEVVSPNQENRDYRYKRSEYAARGIAEYWIVDPVRQVVTLLEWVDGFYEEHQFQGTEPIVSPLLGRLVVTAAEVLQEQAT